MWILVRTRRGLSSVMCKQVDLFDMRTSLNHTRTRFSLGAAARGEPGGEESHWGRGGGVGKGESHEERAMGRREGESGWGGERGKATRREPWGEESHGGDVFEKNHGQGEEYEGSHSEE